MGGLARLFVNYDLVIALGLAGIAVVVFVASRIGVLPKKSVPVAIGALVGLLGLSIWQKSRRNAYQKEAQEIKDRIAERDKIKADLEKRYEGNRAALDRAGAALDQQLAAHELELERLEAESRQARAAIESRSDEEIFEAAHRRTFH